jgi:hypothetical protein
MPMTDAQPYSKVLVDIRERFLSDAAFLRIENCERICDRLTRNSDQNGAVSNPRKVASEGFRDWMENLGKFAAGYLMTLQEWPVPIPSGVSLIRRSGHIFKSLIS